jgi:outer membrane receptor for ferrienterochelin and colicins
MNICRILTWLKDPITKMTIHNKITTTVFVLWAVLYVNNSNAQKDTLSGNSEEIVVTGTRTERKLSNVAIPTKIISQKTIQQAASLRLGDVLQEQPGLFLTANFGAGVQMQGLNPDYTMIMINGEPLVGRTAGVLDLNRVTVGNIKKIEIVKGPSSSLYGSEAMAGVINIITDKSPADKFNASLRYGTYNTLDANVGGGFHIGKLGVNAFVNRYSSDGFSIRPNTVERTVAPLWRLTNQLQLTYPISNKTKVDLSVRYSYEHIKNEYAVSNIGSTTYSQGKEIHKDFNINPVISHTFNTRLKSTLRLYATRFQATQTLNTSSSASSLYDDHLDHQFLRAENQTDLTLNNWVSINVGAGFTQEGVKSTRYETANDRKTNNIGYGFAQGELSPFKKLTLIAGFRYDYNQLFASAFSPKLAAMFKVNDKLKFTASIGRGFKAPDFRQLYLSFTNTAAGSYSVFGTLEAQSQIKKLDQLGQIQSFESDYYRLTDLKPEFSTGINIGTQFQPAKKLTVSINAFRNDIKNLIDTRIVAYYKSGSQIYSYLNVKRAYTKGIEAEAAYRINSHFMLSGGYQLLYTADKEQLADIKAGRVYTKDASGFPRLMDKSEYFGLPNRSRHMGNMKLLYENNAFFINLRAIYRGKWAVSDKDGNGLYNDNDEFADGYVQLNLSVGKQLKNGFRLQAGSDNISNYEDVNNLPNLTGRTFYFLVGYNFSKHKN